MTQEAFETPDLHGALQAAASDEASSDDMLGVVNAFLQSEIYLPAVAAPGEDGSVSPLMLQDEAANPVLPLFSSPEQVPAEYKEQAPHVATVSGIGVLQSVTDAGIVIDPGAAHQFAISQEQMAAIREQITVPGE
ncbi:SseB family protein [Nesterenkonia flava]|uniref:SseB family protein n=1 Tax=Nesterenkonia flava TaxID=469799 RepID=A0ABU1FQC1_9MICC|nr:SseB family protein [Nesterenkonia flava]MDR5710845.1 SseB family protein [Nesterenkonia flava]